MIEVKIPAEVEPTTEDVPLAILRFLMPSRIYDNPFFTAPLPYLPVADNVSFPDTILLIPVLIVDSAASEALYVTP